jgi:hypothetical protein
MNTKLKTKLAGLFTATANIASIASMALLATLTSAATLALFAMLIAGSPAASAADRVPPRLAGQWAIPWSGGTEHLTLYGSSRFRFFFDRYVKFAAHGRLSVRGHTITFHHSNQCTRPGTYQWSLTKGRLTFLQAAGSSDPCPREPILTSGTWTHR